MLQENSASIDNGVALLAPFVQITDVVQGDNLSALLLY